MPTTETDYIVKCPKCGTEYDSMEIPSEWCYDCSMDVMYEEYAKQPSYEESEEYQKAILEIYGDGQSAAGWKDIYGASW